MLAALTVALSLAVGQPAVALPSDPFQACAARVLAGNYGPQPAWKLAAYRRGLEQGVTVRGHALVTWYGPPEPDARHDRRGRLCTLRTAAANLIPENTYVWLENPCAMRQVLDCGAHSNDRMAREKGHTCWVDIWDRRSFGTKYHVHFATIGE